LSKKTIIPRAKRRWYGCAGGVGWCRLTGGTIFPYRPPAAWGDSWDRPTTNDAWHERKSCFTRCRQPGRKNTAGHRPRAESCTIRIFRGRQSY